MASPEYNERLNICRMFGLSFDDTTEEAAFRALEAYDSRPFGSIQGLPKTERIAVVRALWGRRQEERKAGGPSVIQRVMEDIRARARAAAPPPPPATSRERVRNVQEDLRARRAPAPPTSTPSPATEAAPNSAMQSALDKQPLWIRFAFYLEDVAALAGENGDIAEAQKQTLWPLVLGEMPATLEEATEYVRACRRPNVKGIGKKDVLRALALARGYGPLPKLKSINAELSKARKVCGRSSPVVAY